MQIAENRGAMRITRDDNKFKYMDISQQVPMSKQEVKRCYEGMVFLKIKLMLL